MLQSSTTELVWRSDASYLAIRLPSLKFEAGFYLTRYDLEIIELLCPDYPTRVTFTGSYIMPKHQLTVSAYLLWWKSGVPEGVLFREMVKNIDYLHPESIMNQETGRMIYSHLVNRFCSGFFVFATI